MSLCWVVPHNAPACRRDILSFDKRELQDGGYDEYRVVVDDTGDPKRGSVYVQRICGELSRDEWLRAARGLFGSHSTLQVFRPDGSLLVL